MSSSQSSSDRELLALPLPRVSWWEKVRAYAEVLRHGDTDAWERAIHHGRLEAALGLLAIGARADRVESFALFRALMLRDPRLLKYALMAGMNPNQQHGNNYRDYPIHRIVSFGLLERTMLLVAHGADIERLDGNGFSALGTSLHGFGEGQADWEARRAVALALIAAGADVARFQHRDRTAPLALCPMDLPVLQALVAAGADASKLNNPNPSSSFPPLADDPHLLYRAQEITSPDVMRSWLRWMAALGQGPKTPHVHGQTLLGVLVSTTAPGENGHALLDVLTEEGFDLTAPDSHGNTILHAWATPSSKRVPEWVELLLERDEVRSLLGVRNRAGRTASDLLSATSDFWALPARVLEVGLRLAALERAQGLSETLEAVLERGSCKSPAASRRRL